MMVTVPPDAVITGVATVPAGVLVVVGVLMVKLVLVAEVRLGLLADRVYVPAVLYGEVAKGRNTVLWRGRQRSSQAGAAYKGKCARIGGGGDGISVAILDRYRNRR